MKSGIERSLMRIILCCLCLGLLSVFALAGPGMAAAIVTADATATLGVPVFGGVVAPNWADPASVQNSFSSTFIGLNGNTTGFGDSSYTESGWFSTYATANLNDAGGIVTSTASTGPIPFNPLPPPPNVAATLLSSTSSIALNGPVASGDVFTSQAVLSGYFVVNSAGLMTIQAPFSLLASQTNNGGPGSFAVSDALASLSLMRYDANGFDVVATSTSGGHLTSGSDSGIAFIGLNVLPGVLYEFEASATTTASASAVPLPPAFMLLGSGLIGLGIIKRRYIHKA
jgi:hypothetical protein